MYNTLSFTPEDPKETKFQAKLQRKEKEYYYPGLNPVKKKKKNDTLKPLKGQWLPSHKMMDAIEERPTDSRAE